MPAPMLKEAAGCGTWACRPRMWTWLAQSDDGQMPALPQLWDSSPMHSPWHPPQPGAAYGEGPSELYDLATGELVDLKVG